LPRPSCSFEFIIDLQAISQGTDPEIETLILIISSDNQTATHIFPFCKLWSDSEKEKVLLRLMLKRPIQAVLGSSFEVGMLGWPGWYKIPPSELKLEWPHSESWTRGGLFLTIAIHSFTIVSPNSFSVHTKLQCRKQTMSACAILFS
jgi:hypothetical protein